MIDAYIWITPNLYTGKDFPKGPTPDDAKLLEGKLYLMLDYFEGVDWKDESSITVVNDDGEIWSISNRHLRIVKIINKNGKVLFKRSQEY